jgi:esterase/lipase
MVISTSMQNRKSAHINFLKRRKEVLDDMKLYDDDDLYHPFVMHDNCSKMKVKEADSLVVFVHGYQGSDFDLEKAKNYLNIYNPRAHGLMIKTIQDQIDEGIEQLGEKVGEEIKNHIQNSPNKYERISLLGYSLGGVVAREAVRHLEAYKDKMTLMVTFASPHLGVSDPDNQLVKTGIWYLINFLKVKNLKELNCETETEES